MLYIAAAILAVLLAAIVVWRHVESRRRARMEDIAGMISGRNLLAQWPYTPEEWRQAAEDEFDWVRNRDGKGHVYVSPGAIYILGESDEHYIDLTADGRVVTHASCRPSHMSPLKLRLRWKVVRRDDEGRSEVKYYKEDLRIPVPLAYHAEAQRVADFFTAQIENNLEAYTALVPDDEPISLFGKDSF
ncbi:MAG TPA: hypothetical protein VJT74_01250 [Pyrinomonadaceae bacterium]|nr:hypothetical protein [Pyrinomonadaceae bacterium]